MLTQEEGKGVRRRAVQCASYGPFSAFIIWQGGRGQAWASRGPLTGGLARGIERKDSLVG